MKFYGKPTIYGELVIFQDRNGCPREGLGLLRYKN